MTFLYWLAFIFAAVGILLLFEITPRRIAGEFMRYIGRERSIAYRIQLAKGEKEKPKLQSWINDIAYSLEITKSAGRFRFLCIASAVIIVAVCAVCILIGQYFLMPVLAAAVVMIPYLYAQGALRAYRNAVTLELETALSIVTSSFISREDIITAVEESLEYIHHPVCDVFLRFIGRTKLINSNIKLAIKQMREEIDDDIFHEWCDVLIECQDNITLKYNLQPIISKYTDERIVNAELEIELSQERGNFYVLTCMVLANFPLIYFLNSDWFATLTNSLPGKIVIGIVALICFLCILRVRKLTQPIRFKG